jgi:hypothetical protein
MSDDGRKALIPKPASGHEITMLRTFLVERSTFLFRSIGNSLYPASQPASGSATGGYHYAWV